MVHIRISVACEWMTGKPDTGTSRRAARIGETNPDHGPELTSPARSHKVPAFDSNFFSRTVRIVVTSGVNKDIWSGSANIAS